MISLMHNGCSLCVATEGTCWRDAVVERYRTARPGLTNLLQTRRRFSRALLTIVLAPILGGLTGGIIATGLWMLGEPHRVGIRLVEETARLIHG